MTRVLPWYFVTTENLDLSRLLAMFWLHSADDSASSNLTKIQNFVSNQKLEVSDALVDRAAATLGANPVDQWITFVCFWADPPTIWRLMVDAVDVAHTDDDLQAIATDLAEHLLGHYGSTLPWFASKAQHNPKFKRMLTGVWRHKTSTRVWAVIRKIQAEVSDPLDAMISLEHGADYLADHVSDFDQQTDDKAMRYARSESGRWERRAPPKA